MQSTVSLTFATVAGLTMFQSWLLCDVKVADTNTVRLMNLLLFVGICQPDTYDSCRADLLLQQQWADI